LNVQDLMSEGHSAGQIILQLHDTIVPSTDLNDSQKSAICERLAVGIPTNNLFDFIWNLSGFQRELMRVMCYATGMLKLSYIVYELVESSHATFILSLYI